MSKFEWHTEDDWQEEVLQSAENNPRRRWIVSLSIIALIGLVGAVVFTQLRQTVDEATIEIKGDVRATFGLLHESAENSDIELFSTYLSGRDRDWTTGYQQLVGNGSLIERDALRLDLASEQSEIVDIVLGADLRSAILTATTNYIVPIGNGLSQTITLQQPYHFRQGEVQWLFAPPEDDYWGEVQTHLTNVMFYRYPERDEKIVQRLMRDFEAAYGNLCLRESHSLTCVIGQIQFTTDPHLLLGPEMSDDSLYLPTPSLVGLPTNQDSYRALLSSYSTLILRNYLARHSDFAFDRSEPLYYALIDQISAELGLRANLDAPENFRLAQQHLEPNNWPFDWDGTFEDAETSIKINYTFVTFMRRHYPSVSAYEMLALLPRYSQRAAWMQQSIAQVDSTVNNSSEETILETNYVVYQNWLGQRLDSYATIEGR